MKFRVTPASVIVSVLIVVLIAAASVFLSVRSIAESAVDSFLQSIKLPEGIAMEFSSMDRLFLRRVVLSDFSLQLDAEPVFQAHSVEISASLPSLVMHLFGGTDVYDVRFDSPSLRISQRQMERLKEIFKSEKDIEPAAQRIDEGAPYRLELSDNSFQQTYEEARALIVRSRSERFAAAKAGKAGKSGSLLERTGLRIWLAGGSLEAELDAVSVKADGIDSVLSLSQGLRLHSANVNLHEMRSVIGGQEAAFHGLRLALDEKLELSLSFDRAESGWVLLENGYVESGLMPLYAGFASGGAEDEKAKAARDVSLLVVVQEALLDVGGIIVGADFLRAEVNGNPDTLEFVCNGSVSSASVSSGDYSGLMGQLDFAAEGNPERMDCEVSANGIEVGLSGRRVGILSGANLTSRLEPSAMRAAGVLIVSEAGIGALPEIGLEGGRIFDLNLNFYATPQSQKGDFYAFVTGEMENRLLGSFSGDLLADFSIDGSDDYSINAQLKSLELSTLDQKIDVEVSVTDEMAEASALIGSDVRLKASFEPEASSPLNVLASGFGSSGQGSSVPGQDSSMAGQGSSVPGQDDARLTGDESTGTGRLNGMLNVRLEDFTPSEYGFYYGLLSDEMRQMIGEATSLDLHLNARLDGLRPLDMSSRIELAVRDFNLGDNSFNFSVTFDGAVADKTMSVSKLIVSSADYRIDYDGTIRSDVMKLRQSSGALPEGTLSLKRTGDASEIASLELAALGERTYVFSFMVDSMPDFSYLGALELGDNVDYRIDSTLSYAGASYPLDIGLDFSAMRFSALSDGLAIDVAYQNKRLAISAAASDFTFILPKSGSHSLSFDLNALSRTDSSIFNLDCNGFSLKGSALSLLAFDLHADSQNLVLDGIRYGAGLLSDARSLLTGTADFRFDDIRALLRGDFSSFESVVRLESESGERISQACKDSRLFIDVEGFDLARVKLQGKAGIRLLGRIGSDFFGQLEYSNGNQGLSCDIALDSNGFRLVNMVSALDGVRLGDTSVEYSRITRMLDIRLLGSFVQSFYDGDHVSDVDAHLSMHAGAIADTLSDLLPEDGGSVLSLLGYGLDLSSIINEFSAVLEIDKLSLGGFEFKGDEISIDLSGGMLNAHGSWIDLGYSFPEKMISLELNPAWGIGLSMNGRLDFDDLNLDVDSIHFPLVLINQITDMTMAPFRGGVANGSLRVSGSIADPQLDGTLNADNVSVSVFQMPDIVFTVSNGYVAVHGRQIFSPRQRIEFYNERTKGHGYGIFSIAADFSTGFSYDLVLDLPDGTVLPFWLPMEDLGLDFACDAGGLLHVGYDDGDYIKGAISVSNMLVDFSLDDKVIPDWYSKIKPSVDFELDISFLGNNVVCYPAVDNPILNLTLSEGNKLKVSYHHVSNELLLSGDMKIRGGEIYYFQKDFLVTQGKLSFSQDSFFDEAGGLNVSLDLQAKMRDYDSNGNKVDIYLNLQNSSLSNFQPYFTSIPSLSENEILELLGQSILPSSVFSSSPSISSFASLTVAAAEAAGKLGIISTGEANLGLTNVIKNSLGLDIFSVRTNLLQNIVIDALPGSVYNSDLSPISKYLDGTSIYAGKYLTDELFLQSAISLKATSDNKAGMGRFLSRDLRIDLEISLDWENPLATFTVFAQPGELSVFNLFDTMGFSVTKSIRF